MKKSLLYPPAVDEMIQRVEKLDAATTNLWGTMTATEMLLHCTKANTFILEDKSAYKRPSLKILLLRIIVFRLISKFPKNRKGPARIETRGKINDQFFETQKQNFIETIKRFPAHKERFRSIHPGLGFLNRKEWGIAAWMHMDHHLRQFGI